MPDYQMTPEEQSSQKVDRLYFKLENIPRAVGVGSLGANSAVPPAVDDFIRELDNANLTPAEQQQLANKFSNIQNRVLHQFTGSGRYSKLVKVISDLRSGMYKPSFSPQSVRDVTAQMNQNTPEATQPQAATPETDTAETTTTPANEPAPAQEAPAPTSPSQETPAQETTTQETTPPEETPEEEVPTRGAGLGVETADEEDATEIFNTPAENEQESEKYLVANNGVPYYQNDNNVVQGPYTSARDYSYAADAEGNRGIVNQPGEITPENSTITSVRDVTRQMRAKTASRARPAEQQQQQPTAQPTNTAQAPAPQRRYTSAEIEGVDNSDIAPVNQGWYDYIRNQGYGSTSSILSQMGYSQDKIRRMLDSSGAIRPEFLGGR